MKKPLLWGVGVLVVVVIAVVAFGPWLYREFVAGDADPELALPEQTQAATVAVDGTWAVVPGPDDPTDRTQAGYRVDEILRGEPVTVNGRTPQVSGEAVVTANTLESATFTVDVASIASDDGSRDNQFRGERIMDTAQHPTAEFQLAQPVDVSSVPDTGSPVTLDMPGSLTIKDVTQDVSAVVNIQRTGDTIIAVGSVPVTWTDFGVQPPDLGFVSVDPTGTIEFLVNLAKQ